MSDSTSQVSQKTRPAHNPELAEAGAPARSAARSRNRIGQISVGAILSLLMAAIIIPALIFAVMLLQRNNQAQQEMVSTLAEATAGSIAETVDRQLSGMLTTLRVLATSRSAGADNLADFYYRADRALEGSDAYLIITDENLNQLMNTRVPFGSPLGKISDVETARKALASAEPAVSSAFFGQIAQRWVFNVILPVRVDNGQVRLLILTQDAERLSDSLASRNLRGGWNAVLVDGEGTVLTSSYMSSDIGKPFFLAEATSKSEAGSTLRDSVELEGESYETIRSSSSRSDWETIVWAPTAVVQAPLERTLRVLALGGLTIIALGALLAWVLGRQISKPIRRLARDARRLGAGERVEPVEYPVAEISTVSLALAQASVDRQAAENEIRFLMREVAHRSKNQLTVVSSIAKQTARHARTFAAFQDAFQKRVHGLARSTDLLIAGGAVGVELRELIEAQIEPFRPTDSERLEIKGTPFRLSNQAAQTLGLALHELATNASKYGAFATPSGRLTIQWKRSQGQLELLWREFVPRLRRRTVTPGFGTEVIERMLGGTLDAQIERVIHPNGLECRFTIPIARLEPERADAEGDRDEP
ncbi:MAG: sensor histidine kinase [Neoaquamicrobium sediminum]|uniref:sensor histidine kinase n=1 Tax=Neoaquamicrobium sediminum TaxID=1849104 RepID=UPI00403688E1